MSHISELVRKHPCILLDELKEVFGKRKVWASSHHLKPLKQLWIQAIDTRLKTSIHSLIHSFTQCHSKYKACPLILYRNRHTLLKKFDSLTITFFMIILLLLFSQNLFSSLEDLSVFYGPSLKVGIFMLSEFTPAVLLENLQS